MTMAEESIFFSYGHYSTEPKETNLCLAQACNTPLRESHFNKLENIRAHVSTMTR